MALDDESIQIGPLLRDRSLVGGQQPDEVETALRQACDREGLDPAAVIPRLLPAIRNLLAANKKRQLVCDDGGEE